MRTVSPALTKSLGQPVVIENMPGAGGITGTQAIVGSRPDGQTIGVVSNNHVINPSVYSKMPFDSIADITPIMVVGTTPLVLVVNPNKLPVKDVKELVAALKAKPGCLQLRVVGQRHDPASCRGDVHRPGRRDQQPHSIQGRGPDGHGHHGRPGRLGCDVAALDPGASQDRITARDRCRNGAAAGCGARYPDDGRARDAQLSRRRLVRRDRTRQSCRRTRSSGFTRPLPQRWRHPKSRKRWRSKAMSSIRAHPRSRSRSFVPSRTSTRSWSRRPASRSIKGTLQWLISSKIRWD